MRRGLIIAIAAIPLALIIAWLLPLPYYNGDRSTSPRVTCINNLRLIDGAKQEWELVHNKTNGPITWNDILPYIGRDGINSPIPRCPSGGVYSLNNLEDLPTCSIPGHALQPITNRATVNR